MTFTSTSQITPAPSPRYLLLSSCTSNKMQTPFTQRRTLDPSWQSNFKLGNEQISLMVSTKLPVSVHYFFLTLRNTCWVSGCFKSLTYLGNFHLNINFYLLIFLWKKYYFSNTCWLAFSSYLIQTQNFGEYVGRNIRYKEAHYSMTIHNVTHNSSVVSCYLCLPLPLFIFCLSL